VKIFHADIMCPTCTRSIDLGLGLAGQASQPKPGDVAVCAHCFELLMFTGPTTVGVLGEESLEQLSANMRKAITVAREHLANHAQPTCTES